MNYVKVRHDSRCDDCGKHLQHISHFRACPKCKRLSCCTSSTHHTLGGCYDAWLYAKTDVNGLYFR